MSSNGKSLYDKVSKVDRRYIFAIIIFLIAWPLIFPWGLPIKVDPLTQAYYDTIEMLPEGSPILMIMDFESGLAGELKPGAVAVVQHCVDKHFKFIQVVFYRADCAAIFENQVLPNVDLKNYVYGTDWVNIGYVAGVETGMASFASNFLFPGKDAYGTPLAGMPIFQTMKNVNDVALIVAFEPGITDMMLRQMCVPYNKVTVQGTQLMSVPDIISYYQAGLVKGIIGGLPGSAQYEFLRHKPGFAIRGMDALSATQIFLLGAIVVLNVLYFAEKGKKKQGGKT